MRCDQGSDRPSINVIAHFPLSARATAAALGPVAAAKAEDAAGVASSRMSYSRFLEYLEMDRVKKVRGVT